MNFFVGVLREAIEREFGQIKAFAHASGTSPSMMSQILDPNNQTSTRSLAKILRPFSPAQQDKVHRAWINEYAPLPKVESPFHVWHNLLKAIKDLCYCGNPHRALRLALANRKDTHDPVLWQRLTEESVVICLRLQKVGQALELLSQMKERAQRDQNAVQMSAALWLRGCALRAMDGVRNAQLCDSQNDALDYISSWKPKLEDEQETYINRRAAIYRDFAVTILAVNDREPVSEDELVKALGWAKKSLAVSDSSLGLCTSLEVRAQVELCQGQIFKAEESLDEIENQGESIDLDLRQKVGLTRARILIKRGETEKAHHVCNEVSRDSFNLTNLHHHRQAQQMIAKLELGL